MKTSQTLSIRLSEIRQTINELNAKETLGEGEQTKLDELTIEFSEKETKYRAALTVEGEEEARAQGLFEGETSEGREYRELRSRVGLCEYVEAASEKRAVSGAEAEFNQALKIGPHKFPLEALSPIEERATTNVDTVTTPNRWLDRLFSESAASRVGVTFESVAPGAKSYPITKTGASGAQRGRKEAAAVAPWTVGVTELKPTRNSVHAIFSREDDLRNPGLQAALTRDLRMALTDAVDLAIFEGDADANEDGADITGLQTATDVVEEELTQAEKIKGVGVLTAFAALIDGKHATMGSDLKTVLSVGAQRLWMSTLANSGSAVDTTIEEFLRRAGIATTSRGGIDTATTAGKFGAFVGRGRGLVGAGVAAQWTEAMLIVDPYSGAQSGEIQLTMHSFWAFGLPRPSNFARLKFA